MPLDAKAQAILDAERALDLPARHTLSPQEARNQKSTRPLAPEEPLYRIEDRCLPGPAGDISVRIYRPSADQALPVLVFFHGGGWVLGSIDQTDATCRTLANRAACLVISVDYRLAPEHKFPAAAEDAYAVTRWVAENGRDIGADPDRIAVGGLSAGGNLAAVVPLMAKDRGGPPLTFQFLGYPITDCDFETPSYTENAEGYGLSRADMIWFWQHYLPDGDSGRHPYVAPMRAEELSGLPAALVITAEFDPLRDEAESYAERLRQAGVPVVCTRYDGMIHGFVGMAHLLDQGAQAVEQTAAALRAAFAAADVTPAGD